MLFEKLSENEKEMIVEYVNTYAGPSGENPSHQLDIERLPEVLRYWESAKINLFKIFGEKLILEREYKYTPSHSQLESAIDEALYGANSTCSKFLSQWQDFMWGSGSPARRWDSGLRSALLYLMHYDTLIENIYHGENYKIPVREDKFIDLNDGCKVSKVLGKIAKEFKLEGYEEFRIAHSMVLNKTKLSGTMRLSIHPMDFMTMSDNNQDWDSCMSWVNGGEYRQGTVEMMNSHVAVVAYMKSEHDWSPIDWGDSATKYKWNSKKWRKMFIVDPKIILGVKDYPFIHEELSSYCLSWLRELVMASGIYGEYEPTMSKIRTGYDCNTVGEKTKIGFTFYHNFMYNDIYDIHDSYVNVSVESNHHYEIDYSGISECMICGDDISNQKCNLPTDSLNCINCGDYIKCCRCNTSMDKSYDDYHYVDGDYYCCDCADDYIGQCRGCYDRHDVDNMNELQTRFQGKGGITEYFCDDCYTKKIPKYCGEIKIDNRGYYKSWNYVDIESFTPQGFDLFDLDPDDFEPDEPEEV